MNVKRFTARNSREALRLVREALGDDAIVLSTKPAATGVEVMAMAPDSLGRLEAIAAEQAPMPSTAEAASARAAELGATSAEQDADRLSMSTLSFQDYVRKRMLKRRQASREAASGAMPSPAAPTAALATPPATLIGTRLDMRLDDDETFASEIVVPQAAPGDEPEWAAQILEKNLRTAAAHESIEDRGGVFALIGATGVGKTTTTAKIAAAFAARHGAAHLGLITLDAYRVGAHEQLRAYGRILGVPVHTAHDRASLEDLLDLLSAKKMVLIDTAGMAQRDTRTAELLDMLAHRSIQKLLVINAAQQGETIEDVLISYRASSCARVVLSKLDEAIKLGPALDAAIRHKLTIVGVANGQRVPEDWHRLSSNALVQRALRGGGSAAWRLDAAEVNLVFATAPAVSGSTLTA